MSSFPHKISIISWIILMVL